VPNADKVDGSPSSAELDYVTYLWNEYQYRHQLCWNTVYKLTVAVVVLGVIPYARDDLSQQLRHYTLVPPVLAALLAGFGIFVAKNELTLFGKIKLAYRIVQNRLLDSLIADPNVAGHTKEDLTPTTTRRTLFDLFVLLFMATLFLLSILNVFFLTFEWLPYLERPRP
jgi:hypothetical protein